MTANITLSEQQWQDILANARTPKVSRKTFARELQSYGIPKKTAKKIARLTNGHYGEALEYWKISNTETNKDA